MALRNAVAEDLDGGLKRRGWPSLFVKPEPHVGLQSWGSVDKKRKLALGFSPRTVRPNHVAVLCVDHCVHHQSDPMLVGSSCVVTRSTQVRRSSGSPQIV